MATVKFRLQKAFYKGILKKREITIYAIFTLTKQQRFEIKTDEKIEPKYWNSSTQLPKSNYHAYHELSDYLYDFKKRLIANWRENREKGFEAFKIHVKGGIQKKTVIEVFALFLETYEKEKSKNTAKKYGSLKNHLATFLKDNPFEIDQLDFKFYDKFKDFLFKQGTKDKEGNTIGNRDSTVFKYIVNVQTFLTWATDRGFPINPVYKRWEVIDRKTESIYFTIEELSKLEKAFLPEHLSVARDYQIIECRTGMRISDIKAFDQRNLDGSQYFYYQTKGDRMKAKKTFVDFSRAYCAPALEILRKHNFKMPEVYEQKLNKHIKTACRRAGITQPITKTYWIQGEKRTKTLDKCEWITTHVGRKTFINLLADTGMPLIRIAQTLNISERTVRDHYVGSPQDDSNEKYFNLMQTA